MRKRTKAKALKKIAQHPLIRSLVCGADDKGNPRLIKRKYKGYMAIFSDEEFIIMTDNTFRKLGWPLEYRDEHALELHRRLQVKEEVNG